jgi:hypothetical protein
MFSAADKNGFQMTFANGYTISVQWRQGNYCDHYHTDPQPPERLSRESRTAEVALITPNGDFAFVEGWQTADQVAEHITSARSK